MTADRRPVEVEVRQGVMRPGWYWWATTFGLSLLFAVGALSYALHAQAESDRKWCNLIGSLDSAYSQQPPQTDLGKRIARDMHDLHRSLGCS